MPFNGSGTFTLYSPGNPVVTGTTISSTWANNTLTDLATGLSTALTKDGQTTPTANIPMGGFKLTGLGAGTANGDAIRWQQSAAGVLTTLGDTLYASAANTPARLAAKADVAAHATTSDPWIAREVVLTGSAVTFTDIADAPYVGAEVWIYQNAAHTWTNGATFVIQGGANYVAAAGDWIRLYATTVSTFQVTIFKVSGVPISMTPITASLGADVALNNTGAYFDGPSIAQGTVGTWFVSGTVTVNDTAGIAGFNVKLWDGTTVIASARGTQFSGGAAGTPITVSGYITSPAGNLKISVNDASSISGNILFNASGNSKDSTITAIRIA